MGPLHWDVRDSIIALSFMIAGPSSTAMIGDSITEGFWWNQINSCRLVNVGYGGAQAEDVAPRLPGPLATPNYAIIMLGTNNALPNLNADQISSFDRSLQTIVDLLKAKGTVPILASILPIEPGLALSATRSQDSVNSLNRVITGKAISQSIKFVNFDYAFLNAAANAAYHGTTIDGIHPSRPTYISMYYQYADALSKEIARTGISCA